MCSRHETVSEIQALVKNSGVLLQFDQKLSQGAHDRSFHVLPVSVNKELQALGVKQGPLKFLLLQRNKNSEQEEVQSLCEVNLTLSVKTGRACLCRGWVRFLQMNNICAGDTLRFSLHCPHVWAVCILQSHSKPSPPPSPSPSPPPPPPPPSPPPPPPPSSSTSQLSLPAGEIIFHLLIQPKHLTDPFSIDVPREFAEMMMPDRDCGVNIRSKSSELCCSGGRWIHSSKKIQGAKGSLSEICADVGDLLIIQILDPSPPLTIQLHLYKEGIGTPF